MGLVIVLIWEKVMSDDSLQIFADEAEDLLGSAEQALLNLDDVSHADEMVGDLFRTFHTIKGAAGLFGLDTIVDFTHVVESVLGKIREGELAVDETMVSLFLTSRDHLENLVGNALSDAEGLDVLLQKIDDDLIAQLNAYLRVSKAESDSIADEVESDASNEGVDNENWHISLRFGPNAIRNGMDPASFINYLTKLGELKSVILIDDATPKWDEFDPESCYLGFEIDLFAPNATKEIIEEVFEFVQDECKISILPPHSHIDVYIKMIENLPEEDMRIGDILVACGALTMLEKDNVLNAQEYITDEVTAGIKNVKVPPLGEVAVKKQVIQQEVIDAAVKKQVGLKQQRVNQPLESMLLSLKILLI
jgi:two-component system chemotaxis sensor kinase CheA